jgi:hypothetical protein
MALARRAIWLAAVLALGMAAAPVESFEGANLASYADPALPLAPGVVEAIADFVRGHA